MLHSLEEAVELLLEVVRLAPNAADPYRTLGNIYEVRGDHRKALHFFMIAAHLPPKVLRRLSRGASRCSINICLYAEPFAAQLGTAFFVHSWNFLNVLGPVRSGDFAVRP